MGEVANYAPSSRQKRRRSQPITGLAAVHATNQTQAGLEGSSNTLFPSTIIFKIVDLGTVSFHIRCGSIFIEVGSGQKCKSGSRRPLNPDPNCFKTLSVINLKLFRFIIIRFSCHKKSIERYNVSKVKLFCGDLTF